MSDVIATWEQFTQDEHEIIIERYGREKYRARCECGWTAKHGGETGITNLVGDHILEHDIEYEEGLVWDESEIW